jgi:hypothetical protein
MALAGSVGIAVLSYRYIEGPYRKRKLAGTRKAVLVHAVAGILGILGVGALCAAVRGFPSRFSEQAQNFENARNDWSYRDQHTVADARLGRLT